MPATTSSIELWPQDEISMIFIVGFPDDMSVSILYGYNPSTELCPGTRVPKHVYLFSRFQVVAATLTILNKEVTAYGSSTRHTTSMNQPLCISPYISHSGMALATS